MQYRSLQPVNDPARNRKINHHLLPFLHPPNCLSGRWGERLFCDVTKGCRITPNTGKGQQGITFSDGGYKQRAKKD